MNNVQLTPRYVHVTRYPAGSPESLDHLESEGFVIIEGALSGTEADHALDLTWDYLEGLGTGIDRDDAGTWSDDRWPITTSGGIIPALGIGHSAAQWFVRSAPSIKTAFASIWGDDDLLVSFDGMALWRPTNVDPGWVTTRGGSWMHIDQHPITRPGRQCVQGAVTLMPTSAAAGGNILIPGSHKWFADIPERYTDRLGRIPRWLDHFRFPTDDPRLFDTPPVMCHMEAGDMMLWDSRTVHCSSPGIEEARAAPIGAPVALQRAASLICMMPKARANKEVIAERRAAVGARISTTNWTDRFFSTDEYPEMLAGDPSRFQLPPVPELDEELMALVG